MTLCKTERGTLSSKRFETDNAKGVAVGKYEAESVCSFEYREEEDQLVLFIFDDAVKKLGVEVRHVNTDDL